MPLSSARREEIWNKIIWLAVLILFVGLTILTSYFYYRGKKYHHIAEAMSEAMVKQYKYDSVAAKIKVDSLKKKITNDALTYVGYSKETDCLVALVSFAELNGKPYSRSGFPATALQASKTKVAGEECVGRFPGLLDGDTYALRAVAEARAHPSAKIHPKPASKPKPKAIVRKKR